MVTNVQYSFYNQANRQRTHNTHTTHKHTPIEESKTGLSGMIVSSHLLQEEAKEGLCAPADGNI